MNDNRHESDRDDPGDAPSPSNAPTEQDDLEGHAATIYRRRRGPYPLRNAASLPDADDRQRREGTGRTIRPTL